MNTVGNAIGVLCLACLAVGGLAAQAPAGQRPNVILVMTDDQGYGDLACHGNTKIRTPNLDRLHSRGVRLTQFHVDPTCSPTRAALLTGRYSTRAGVWHTIAGRSLMYRDEVTLAEVLSQAGYATALMGKWHLGDNYPLRPQDRGFHEVLVHGGGGIGQTPDSWGNHYTNATFLHNGSPRAFPGYCTDVFFSQALRFIETHREQPFFVYLALNAPHGPYEVPDSYRRHYHDAGVPPPMNRFYGMIDNIDENLGRLRTRLREWHLEENTILIFLTDNGTAAGVAPPPKTSPGTPAPWTGFDAGMRGQKGSAYEGGHRVPCFVLWRDGGIHGGRDIPWLTAHFDLFPTLLDLCGVPPPQNVALDGISLAPWLKGTRRPPPDRTLIVHSQRVQTPQKWKTSSVMSDRWRLINGRELYNLVTDPGQTSNIAAQHPAMVDQLRAAYERWWNSLTPRMEDVAWIVVGAPAANPARLTCHDWHASDAQVPWSQAAVRKLPQANGAWMIEVAQPGTYLFTLRHQPPPAAVPLRATRARLRIGTLESKTNVATNATEVTLSLTLEPGRFPLQTWLETELESRGAFFVDVERRP